MPIDKDLLKGFVDFNNTSQHAADSVMNRYFVGFPYSLSSQNEEYVSGIEDITDLVRNGYSSLYSRDGMPGYSFYADGSGRVYRVSDAENINTSGMSPLSYSDMRKMLPKREYIGGKDYRFKTAQRIPGFLDKIKERAEAYGIDPNLVLNRILHEGWIDQQVINYNGLDASQQGGYWSGLWDAPVSGYGSFGLDYAGNNLMNGVYELKDPDASWRSAEFTDYEGGNSFRTGTSLEADNLSSAIEILAAELAYRQGEVAKKYRKKDSDLNVWTNAAFNMGLNHKDLKNDDWVRSKYTYPDYYGQMETQKKLGGIIQRFGADRLQQYFASGCGLKSKIKKVVEKKLRKHLFGDMTDEEVRRRLYDNLYPFNYGEGGIDSILERVKYAVDGNPDYGFMQIEGPLDDEEIKKLQTGEFDYPGERDDIFATYLGIPEEERHKNLNGKVTKVEPSKYSPSVGNEGNKYYRLSGIDTSDPLNFQYFINDGSELPIGKSKVSNWLGPWLGDHTVSHGLDDNGEYVSYYDLWDINPFYGRNGTSSGKYIDIPNIIPHFLKLDNGQSNSWLEGVMNGDIKYIYTPNSIHIKIPNPLEPDTNIDTGDKSMGIGTPVHFYDRIYLDDYYGVDSKPEDGSYYGGYLPAAIKYGDYASGGKIHIKQENRGKFNEIKRRTGKTTEELTHSKNPLTRKRAIFAQNAAKWKHGDGGPLDKYTPEQIRIALNKMKQFK